MAGDPAHRRGLKLGDPSGLFQPRAFCDEDFLAECLEKDNSVTYSYNESSDGLFRS